MIKLTRKWQKIFNNLAIAFVICETGRLVRIEKQSALAIIEILGAILVIVTQIYNIPEKIIDHE